MFQIIQKEIKTKKLLRPFFPIQIKTNNPIIHLLQTGKALQYIENKLYKQNT